MFRLFQTANWFWDLTEQFSWCTQRSFCSKRSQWRFVRSICSIIIFFLDLLLILFLFRLWARCFKMFGDSEEPKGHWSSYALSLIFVQFCQLQDYITEVQRTGTETIKGWAIGYKVMERPLKSCGLDELFLVSFDLNTAFLLALYRNSSSFSPLNLIKSRCWVCVTAKCTSPTISWMRLMIEWRKNSNSRWSTFKIRSS